MKIIIAFTMALLASAFIYSTDLYQAFTGTAQAESQKDKQKTKKKGNPASDDVSILNKWELPAELREISGLVYLDANRFACVQDEEGTVYIYNVSSNKIEKKISIAGAGDFEGIAMKNDAIFIVRSDGKLFESNTKGDKTIEHATALKQAHNIEGLCYDEKNNRLLLATKDEDPDHPGNRCIYAFDLSSKTLLKEPIIKIPETENLASSKGKKKSKSVMPTAIAVHPGTGEIFITDAPGSRLIVMDPSGKIKNTYALGKEFSQPEGIAFDPAGVLYISNEGKKQNGNIMRVELKEGE